MDRCVVHWTSPDDVFKLSYLYQCAVCNWKFKLSDLYQCEGKAGVVLVSGDAACLDVAIK